MYLDLSAVDVSIDAAAMAQVVADTVEHDSGEAAGVVDELDRILEDVGFPKAVFIAMGKVLAEEDLLVETLRELMTHVTDKEEVS